MKRIKNYSWLLRVLKLSNQAQKNAERLGGILPFSLTVAELKKVHMPSRQETIQATLEVFLMLVVLAFFLGLADLLLARLMQAVLT